MESQELIPVVESKINDEVKITCNARDLHAFLGVGKFFANWIKDRITKYDFKENIDFVVIAKFGNNPQGGRPEVEYHLTLDMAKELAMVENNPQGRKARQYFIECERRYRTQVPAPTINYQERISLLEEENRFYLKKVIDLQNEKIQENASKVVFANAVEASSQTMEVGELAAILQQAGYSTSRNKLLAELRELGWLIKQEGDRWNMPTQRALNQGLIVETEQLIKTREGDIVYINPGRPKVVKVAKITAAGQRFFFKYFTDKIPRPLFS